MSWGQRTCMECGVVFEAQYPAQVCCSKPCAARRKLKQSNIRKKSTNARRIEEIARLREDVKVAQRKMGKLRKTLEKIAGRKRFLALRCTELVEQVHRQEEEINALRCKIARFEMQTASAKKTGEKKRDLDERLRAIQQQVKAELSPLLECKRMNARGTSLPCGKRVECYATTRCEHVPDGMRLEL